MSEKKIEIERPLGQTIIIGLGSECAGIGAGSIVAGAAAGVLTNMTGLTKIGKICCVIGTAALSIAAGKVAKEAAKDAIASTFDLCTQIKNIFTRKIEEQPQQQTEEAT